jgi:outer membrane protein assembly factor BamB
MYLGMSRVSFLPSSTRGARRIGHPAGRILAAGDQTATERGSYVDADGNAGDPPLGSPHARDTFDGEVAWRISLAIVASGCGRVGFSPLGDGGQDAAAVAQLCGDTSGLAAGSPWPLIHGCPTNAGRSAFLGPATGNTELGPIGTATNARGAVVSASGTIIVQEVVGQVHAFDGSSGLQVWTSPAASAAVEPFPIIGADGMLYTATSNGQVYGRNLTTGAVAWTLQLAGSFSAPVMDAPGSFYFGAGPNYGFYAVDTATQAQKWHFGVTGDVSETAPALTSGRVYFVDTINSQLYALDAATGAHVFDVPVPGMAKGAPVVGIDALYVATTTNGIVAFDLHTGATRWQQSPGADVVQPALLANGDLFSSTTSGVAFVLGRTDGLQRQSFPLGASVYGVPLLDAADTAYFATSAGTAAYDVATGAQVWQSPLFSGPTGRMALGDRRIIVLLGTQTFAVIGP